MARRCRIAPFLLAVAAVPAFACSAQAQSSANTTVLSVTSTTPRIVERTGGTRAEAVFVIRRTGNRAQTIRFGYSICCNTTDAGYDHDVVGANIQWDGSGDDDGDGNADTYTVRIDIGNDADIEPDERFGLQAHPIEGDVQAETSQAQVTIVDDDGRPAGTVVDVGDPAPIGESFTGDTRNVTFPLTLSNAGTVPMTISYATADVSAAGGDDYTPGSGSVTFAPGERTKNVTVAVVGDDSFEPDETFKLVLSNPTAAGPGREGTATIINDDAEPLPPEPPPPGPPSDHTLLGYATYVPAFGVGFKGLEVLGPFAALPRPRELSVKLVGPDGAVRREQRVTGFQGIAAGAGPVPYRFDALPECSGCSVQLFGDATIQDVAPVSFDGEAGQTDLDLQYGRPRQGAVLEGTVIAPTGAGPSEMTVQLQDVSGKVLATTANAPFKCRDATTCPSADTYGYRLTGLPSAAIPARAVLMQGGASRRQVPVDSVDLTLDPSGFTVAPDLNGVYDAPRSASGRTLYGQINNRKAFGPGDLTTKDLAINRDSKDDLSVELRRANGSVAAKTRKEFVPGRSGYLGYELIKLDECSDCTVVLLDGKKVVKSLPVVLPKATPSVVRRDFDIARGSDPEYATGDVLTTQTRPARLEVALVDPATGRKLVESPRGDAGCGGNARCPIGSALPYRLDGVPADRDVIATVYLGGKPVNQRRLRTAPAGETTQIPALALPIGKGPRSVQGKILNAGSFAPGRGPAEFSKGLDVDALLLDANGAQVGKASTRIGIPDGNSKRDFFVLDNLAPCQGCVIELRTRNALEDRVPIELTADSPFVAVADMSWQALSGGAFVEGKIVERGRGIRPSELVVQVLSSTNKVLVDSSKLPDLKQQPADASSLAYRLGGIPRDAGKVTIVVQARKKRLASTTVTIAPGMADTAVPDLKIDTNDRDR